MHLLSKYIYYNTKIVILVTYLSTRAERVGGRVQESEKIKNAYISTKKKLTPSMHIIKL